VTNDNFQKEQNFCQTGGFITDDGFAERGSGRADPAAARYDNQIQTTLSQKLAAKNQFHAVTSSVEDGIVTLTGTVDLYQRKLDAAKLARKTASVQGVRNLITVAGRIFPTHNWSRNWLKSCAMCARATTSHSITSRST
jgi:hypothetical protein